MKGAAGSAGRSSPTSLPISKSPSRPSPSRSGLRGFWMRRTPCGPSAASPSPSSTSLLQSTFLDMFGDPVTNPMGWEVRPLNSNSFSQIGRSTYGILKPKGRVFEYRNPHGVPYGQCVLWRGDIQKEQVLTEQLRCTAV